MKFLILVITIAWSFGHPCPEPTSQIVSSPESAALIVYADKKEAGFFTEPDRKEYKLYSVDLASKAIKEVSIPTVAFKKAAPEE